MFLPTFTEILPPQTETLSHAEYELVVRQAANGQTQCSMLTIVGRNNNSDKRYLNFL